MTIFILYKNVQYANTFLDPKQQELLSINQENKKLRKFNP